MFCLNASWTGVILVFVVNEYSIGYSIRYIASQQRTDQVSVFALLLLLYSGSLSCVR